jgi:hypothetical protein
MFTLGLVFHNPTLILLKLIPAKHNLKGWVCSNGANLKSAKTSKNLVYQNHLVVDLMTLAC